MLRQTMAGVRILIVLTILTGILYPLGIWAVSRIPGLAHNAEGSVITVDGQAVGSEHIGVDPVAKDPANDPWFHNRPSAGAEGPLGPGDPATSGGSNKGLSDAELAATVNERKKLIADRERVEPSQVPVDAVTASASGLDPDISEAYAALQVPRVARVTGLSENRVRELVAEHTAGRGIGVLGEPTVNVLELNLAVQEEARTGG